MKTDYWNGADSNTTMENRFNSEEDMFKWIVVNGTAGCDICGKNITDFVDYEGLLEYAKSAKPLRFDRELPPVYYTLGYVLKEISDHLLPSTDVMKDYVIVSTGMRYGIKNKHTGSITMFRGNGNIEYRFDEDDKFIDHISEELAVSTNTIRLIGKNKQREYNFMEKWNQVICPELLRMFDIDFTISSLHKYFDLRLSSSICLGTFIERLLCGRGSVRMNACFASEDACNTGGIDKRYDKFIDYMIDLYGGGVAGAATNSRYVNEPTLENAHLAGIEFVYWYIKYDTEDVYNDNGDFLGSCERGIRVYPKISDEITRFIELLYSNDDVYQLTEI